MSIPIIFDPQPVLTKRHSRELAFSNDHVLREWLKTPRRPDDYRRAVLVELERESPRLPMIQKLLIALQRLERQETERAVAKHLSKKK